MVETASKLEGLQAIIPPVPPLSDGSGWIVPAIVLLGLVLSAIVVLVLTQRHGGYRARRSFSHLKSHVENMQPVDIGDGLITVLRIALNSQNLQQSHKPESVVTISQHEWSTLLRHCDLLRFASGRCNQHVIPEALELVHKLLRGHA